MLLNVNDSTEVHRLWFAAELSGRPKSGSGRVSFTIRFKAGGQDSWKWARDSFSLGDGELYYQSSSTEDHDLSYYFDDLSTDLKPVKQASDTPGTTLWSVTASVNAASGNDSGWSSYNLGKPKAYSRWFSLVRLWTPWLAPRHGKDSFKLDKDGILAAFLRQDGQSVVCLPVSGIADVLTVLQHDESGRVVVKGRNENKTKGTLQVLVAVAKSFELANCAVMYHARKLVTAHEIATGLIGDEVQALIESQPSAQWLEEWYDGFSYCTWNGLGQQLTEQKIYEALESLKKNNIHITNLIIDDNWQTLDQEGANQPQKAWKEFEANKEGFPNGLAHTVRKIRADNPSISHVAVWHALIGYWGGISPEGKIAKQYKTCEVRKSQGVTGNKWLLVDKEDVNKFYNDFYTFLQSSGVDSVKTDAQFSLDELIDAPDRQRLIRAYQDAWTLASLRHFSSKAISCMSQVPQIMFHSMMPKNKPRILIRNSDDFFPDIEDSHPWHIFCNAHNALFTQHLNALPDWDMFQTSHPWAKFHAAARCVSGGPIYFTDTPGKHDPALINQMTAQTPRGNTVILRPHIVGKSSQAYLGYEEQVLLKIETYVGGKHTGVGILGVFNVTRSQIAEVISLKDFPGTEQGEYVIRAHTTGSISSSMTRSASNNFVMLDVPSRGWEILSAYPLHTYEVSKAGKTRKFQIANLGLLGKMTGAAALLNTMIETTTDRLKVWTSLKALGVYGKFMMIFQSQGYSAILTTCRALYLWNCKSLTRE